MRTLAGVAAGCILIPWCVVMTHAQGAGNLMKNGDFERFAGDEPVGWETSNIPRMCTVVSASARAHGGKLAVKLEVKECFGSKVPGMITQKNIRVTGRDYKMAFFYLVKSVGGDVGYVSMDFKNAEGSTIRMCEQRLIDTKDAFVPLNVNFPAPEGATAGDLRIALLAGRSDGSLHEGSYLLIDDMVLAPTMEKAESKGH